ncbi:type II toxin-antitoxin system Phd/YefM family antitoxin [Nocardia stercoris]|nr:type II toxin-antitoxin system prevent-host-death family antitoxin [Nocardia stercoris]
MARMITQAELRNGSAGIMDALEAGEEFIITRNGRPVGELRPIAPRRDVPISEIKALMAPFRSIRSEQVRAEIDAVFREERLDD